MFMSYIIYVWFMCNTGYEVEGVYMKNWDEMDERGVCPSQRDYNDVKWVCHKLDIPCHKVEFVREYWNEVFR